MIAIVEQNAREAELKQKKYIAVEYQHKVKKGSCRKGSKARGKRQRKQNNNNTVVGGEINLTERSEEERS